MQDTGFIYLVHARKSRFETLCWGMTSLLGLFRQRTAAESARSGF